MNLTDLIGTRERSGIFTCPNCGSDYHESNRFDDAETHCRQALADVSLLLFDGRYHEARRLLTTYCRVWIENILRPQFLCLSCGVQFGGVNFRVPSHG